MVMPAVPRGQEPGTGRIGAIACSLAGVFAARACRARLPARPYAGPEPVAAGSGEAASGGGASMRRWKARSRISAGDRSA
jgi:hypothetical protein